MTSTNLAFRRVVVAWMSVLAVFLCSGLGQTQAGPEGPAFKTITVTGARPVAMAMDAIEQRYGVLIDYMDAPWVAPQDVQLYHSLPGRPPMPPSLGPKTWTISVHYWQVPGTPASVAPIYRCNTATLGCAPVTARPREGIEGLIREVLHQFAEQGGQVFTVRKLEMPYGARWEVYPTYARDRSGTMVAQPDFFSTRISIPKARRWPAEMLNLIAQQLTQATGSKFSVGTLGWAVLEPAYNSRVQPPELGAENVSAWRAIADLMGPVVGPNLGVLRVRYGICEPNCGYEYGINIGNMPYREPPRPPTPAPVPAKPLPPPPRPPRYWQARAHTPQGILQIQGVLAELGYLRTAPTTQWDTNATAALRRFQYAVGLPQTGKFDHWTALKLSVSLPKAPMWLRAKPAMSIALLDWLNTTPDGAKEVQQALTKAGFYSGPIDGQLDLPTVEALKAFQTANGLKPTGVVDWATAVKLSPLLPEPK